MATNKVDFMQGLTADTYRRPSPSIWGDCPVAAIKENPEIGVYYYDDFGDLPLAPTLTTQIAYGKYKAFGDTGNTITKVGAVNSVALMAGALQLAIDTDNDSTSIAQAYPTFLLTGLTSNSGKLWFEACVAQNSIVTNLANWFVGLAEVNLLTLSSTVPWADDGTLSNAGAFIGFAHAEDGVGVVNSVYNDRATTFTNVQAGIKTMAAYTFTKFGFVYDPLVAGANCVTFYVDGQPQTSFLTKTVLQALTNLDANPLGLILSTSADSAGTTWALFMKWWACAQMFPSAS
jgi:hypothetical protein